MSLKKPAVFFPNLDGLRFFCFLSVFLYHSFTPFYKEIKETALYNTVDFLFRNGNLGVNFFFVLSGFLITYLLFVEREKLGKIDIPAFYVRRILRIWPLFFLCVIFGFVLFPYLKGFFGETSNETARPLYYFFFLNNFDFIQRGVPDSSTLGVLWSVAIEEQFYLTWPILIALAFKKNLPVLFLSIIAGTFVFRWLYAGNYLMLEYHTLSCISDMAVGGLFAYISFYKKALLERLSHLPKTTWIVLYTVIGMIYFFRKELFGAGSFLLAIDRLVISVLFALVIVEQNFARNSLFKVGNLKTISLLGKYTYGLYCLHMIAILVVNKSLHQLNLDKNVYQVIFLEGSFSFLLTLLLAISSYKLFESRFLLLKNRFAKVKTQYVDPGNQEWSMKKNVTVADKAS